MKSEMSSPRDRPKTDWITIPVPALIDERIFGSPKEFVGEFRPPITPAMVAMNICKGKVTIAALSGFADLAFANIHG
jgi:hypothetical protein